MKKVALWIVMFGVAIVCIPLSFVLSKDVSFNVAINAFFNNSYETMAFYFLQFLLMIILTEIIIQSKKTKNTFFLQWINIVMLAAFVISKWYIYYLALVLISWLCMLFIQHEKNQQIDEITEIIHDVKEEYMDK